MLSKRQERLEHLNVWVEERNLCSFREFQREDNGYVWGGQRQRMLSSSLFCSPASSFVLFWGIRAVHPFLFSSQFPLGTNSNHLPGPLGPLGKVRTVSFETKQQQDTAAPSALG